MTRSGHAGYLWRCGGGAQSRRGRTRRRDKDHARTAASRAEGVGAMEASDVLAKTMRGRRHPTPREVARWKPAMSLRGDGDESVQRRENHQEHTCQRRHVGSRRDGPKAVTLRPEGATQRQPDARTVVGACSGTYLAETCTRLGYQTDGGAVRQVLDDGTQIGTRGVVVGEVPGDNGEDGPRWRPRRRGAGSDAPRCPSDDASDVATRLVKASRPARSRRRRDDRGSLPR
jgi:hypothetical protein